MRARADDDRFTSRPKSEYVQLYTVYNTLHLRVVAIVALVATAIIVGVIGADIVAAIMAAAGMVGVAIAT